jgi:hypothetical protein
LTRKKRRDIYGNWVNEDNEIQNPGSAVKTGNERSSGDDDLALDWRDYIAITLASLQTFLLPIVVLIVLLVSIVLGLAYFR